MKKTYLLLIKCLSVCCPLVFASFMPFKVAYATSISVQAEIEAGTCDVSIGQPKIELKPISDLDIKDGKQPLNLEKITLKISNCTGRGAANAKPKVTITGNTIGNETHLFREATSTADKRIGIVLASKENPGAPDSGWDNYISNKDSILIAADNVTTISKAVEKDLWLGTSCGSVKQCKGDGSALEGGVAMASFLFEFKYK